MARSAGMPPRFSWDDARVLLALARAGSAAAAASALGVSPPTVGRRLRALEAATGGAPLAHQVDGQLVLAPAGRRLIAAAERMEAAAAELGRGARGAAGTGSEPVRVTAIAAVAHLLLHGLGPFLAAPDAPPLEILVTPAPLSLPRGEADLALRMGRLPRAEGLRCRRLGAVSYALYRRRGAAPPPGGGFVGDAPSAATHGGRAASPQAQWVDAEAARSGARVRLRVSDPTLRLEACAIGLGAALLPTFQGDAAPGLERVGAPIARLGEGVFLLAHPDALRRTGVRAVADAIAAIFRSSA